MTNTELTRQLGGFGEHLDAGATSVVIQVLGASLTEPPRADWAQWATALL